MESGRRSSHMPEIGITRVLAAGRTPLVCRRQDAYCCGLTKGESLTRGCQGRLARPALLTDARQEVPHAVQIPSAPSSRAEARRTAGAVRPAYAHTSLRPPT